jgi:hypothetical protein
VGDLVPGQRDLVCGAGVAGVLKGGGDAEDDSGEHGQGDPPVPGDPAADLVLVEAGEALDGPAEPRDPDEGGQRDRVRAVAVLEGQFAGAPVPPDEQVPASRAVAVDGDPGPAAPALPLGAEKGLGPGGDDCGQRIVGRMWDRSSSQAKNRMKARRDRRHDRG